MSLLSLMRSKERFLILIYTVDTGIISMRTKKSFAPYIGKSNKNYSRKSINGLGIGSGFFIAQRNYMTKGSTNEMEKFASLVC